jgi:hypothetical protein
MTVSSTSNQQLEREIESLKRRITTATMSQVRAQAEREAAEQGAREARDRLAEQFKVSGPDEGRVLLDQMTRRLAELTDQVSAQLDEIGF